MDRKPIIGITAAEKNGNITVNPEYINAVSASGGIPVVLTYKDKFRITNDPYMIDGLLITGGCDVLPSRYSETPINESVVSDAARDDYEFTILNEFLRTGRPVLGICRGMQLLNVAFGGSLYQDIENHRQSEKKSETPFEAMIEKDTLLYEIVKKDIVNINSFHHQAVKKIAPGFKVSAYSKDGIIEAIEYENSSERTVIGVQWHPEGFYDKDRSSSSIFDYFVVQTSKHI